VFGFAAGGGGAAELALLADYAPIPPSLHFLQAASLPVAVETAGEGLVERVRELAPDGVDAALDAAGGGALPALIELSSDPEQRISESGHVRGKLVLLVG
jgi:hypothetical protein